MGCIGTFPSELAVPEITSSRAVTDLISLRPSLILGCRSCLIFRALVCSHGALKISNSCEHSGWSLQSFGELLVELLNRGLSQFGATNRKLVLYQAVALLVGLVGVDALRYREQPPFLIHLA